MDLGRIYLGGGIQDTRGEGLVSVLSTDVSQDLGRATIYGPSYHRPLLLSRSNAHACTIRALCVSSRLISSDHVRLWVCTICSLPEITRQRATISVRVRAPSRQHPCGTFDGYVQRPSARGGKRTGRAAQRSTAPREVGLGLEETRLSSSRCSLRCIWRLAPLRCAANRVASVALEGPGRSVYGGWLCEDVQVRYAYAYARVPLRTEIHAARCAG
ncbi:hypothetical protein C2E23DRAFT_25510 [Lenzites betulinus]|nr:hypothetical protein C2E23DRAFT_25510 [Lenzites betulinus]